jgi:1,4-dihydroxy-2-naphthoate octaprenyltransferase
MKLAEAIPPIFRIIRIHIVLGGVLAFSLGALLALVNGGNFDLLQIVLFYLIVFFGDLSTHYSNDYFDVEVDQYVEKKGLFSGSNILVNYRNLLPLARKISIVFLFLSNILAVLLVLFCTAPIEMLIITLVANFLGLAYSAPPLRLISRGFGELAIAIAVGFAIPAVGYLSIRGRLDPLFLYLGLPFIMYGLILSFSLEAPDIEIDSRAGKTNIAVRKSERATITLVLSLVLIATLIFLMYAWLMVATLDLWIVFLISIVPLSAGLLGLVISSQKNRLTVFSTSNIISLFCFNVLMITYLLIITLAN